MAPPTITDIGGYLEDEYLEGEYDGGAFAYGYGMQALMVIVNVTMVVGMQADQAIAAQEPYGMQAQMVIAADREVGMQAYQQTSGENEVGMQAQSLVEDVGGTVGMEAKHDTLRHAMRGMYLEEGGYLEEDYLVEGMWAFLGMQALQSLTDYPVSFGMQALQIINRDKLVGMQAEMVINTSNEFGMQAAQFVARRIGMQATMVLYNTTELRFMTEFPSRGTPALLGNNWTATNTAAGDFLVRNVNTDTEEQVYRSTGLSIELVCDTGLAQGVPIDTIAIRNHNLTRGALVQVQGSNDNFATVAVTYNMFVETTHMYYIAPSFPTSLETNRYWKFIIQDVTNPDGYIQVGAILFGAASIFSTTDKFLNPLTQGYKHFKDVLPTEGFSNTMNDRSLKKYLRLNFQDIDYLSGNFSILEDMFLLARTSLKVLVIPTPEFASRFAVFAKLSSMPEITHINHGFQGVGGAMVEYDSLSLEYDESL